jgi:esterase/lipase
MSTVHLVPEDLRSRYHVKEWRNATGILTTAHPGPWRDIIEVLRGFTLLRSEIDHTLPSTNSEEILSRIGSLSKEEIVLSNSFHVAPLDHDQDYLFKASLVFIRRHSVL